MIISGVGGIRFPSENVTMQKWMHFLGPAAGIVPDHLPGSTPHQPDQHETEHRGCDAGDAKR
jgi:hypothetical protein